MNREALSLKVLPAYARDVGRGVVRIDHSSMDSLGISAGDTIEIIGKKDGMDAKCYPLLPSDEGQGITRIDPNIRKIIGATIDDIISIRKTTPVPAENFAASEDPKEDGNADSQEALSTPQLPPTDVSGTKGEISTVITLSGSSLDFNKERPKIMEFITTLESGARIESKCKCYSDGKKALGWDFFMLELDLQFAERLLDLYPDIDKQEAGMMEEKLALWMNKQLKKMKLDLHLKLSGVPYEQVKGFRLDPEHYRDKADPEDLR